MEEILVLKCKNSEDEAPKFSVIYIIGFVNKCAFIYVCVLADRAVDFTLPPVVFVQILVKNQKKNPKNNSVSNSNFQNSQAKLEN